MRMPGHDRAPLPRYLQELRRRIADLPTEDRRALLAAVWADNVRRNDARNLEAAIRAERAIAQNRRAS